MKTLTPNFVAVMHRFTTAILLVLMGGLTACFGWELTMIETRGSAYERGLQHGRKLRAEIQRDFGQKSGWGWSAAMRFRAPEALSGWAKRLQALPRGQELLDEMQGIAEGAGVSFYDIAALNFTYDLGERTACSMALLPTTADGPILLNTLDDFPNGKQRQNYPCFVQAAYPTDGHALVFLCNYGAVWAHQGLNDAGLAMGSTSGGIGAPRCGTNYEGMYYALLSRYALQFLDSADDVIKLFVPNRQISKGINVSVLDRTGQGAVLEYSAFAVGVRPTKTTEPLYATNFFQTDKQPPYDKSVEEYDYMKNARARYRRFGELFAAMKATDFASAQRVLLDDNGGRQGQICQDNNVMITATANLFVCREATAHIYLSHPKQVQPVIVRLDAKKKPTVGKPPPPNDQVEAVNRATPKTFKPTHHQFKGVTITAVDHPNVVCTVRLPQGERKADLSAATIMLLTPGALADAPASRFTVLHGKRLENPDSFEAAEIILYRGYGNDYGRLLADEASGRLHQKDGVIEMEYEQGKRIRVTLTKGCKVMVAHKVSPNEVNAPASADLYGYTLEPDGDIVATWLNVHLSTIH